MKDSDIYEHITEWKKVRQKERMKEKMKEKKDQEKIIFLNAPEERMFFEFIGISVPRPQSISWVPYQQSSKEILRILGK